MVAQFLGESLLSPGSRPFRGGPRRGAAARSAHSSRQSSDSIRRRSVASLRCSGRRWSSASWPAVFRRSSSAFDPAKVLKGDITRGRARVCSAPPRRRAVRDLDRARDRDGVVYRQVSSRERRLGYTKQIVVVSGRVRRARRARRSSRESGSRIRRSTRPRRQPRPGLPLLGDSVRAERETRRGRPAYCSWPSTSVISRPTGSTWWRAARSRTRRHRPGRHRAGPGSGGLTS